MTNKELISRLSQEIKPHLGRLSIAMVCMVVFSACTGAQAYLVKDLLDKIFIEKNVFFLNILPAIVILVFMIKAIFYYIYATTLEFVGQSVIRDLRNRIFSHIHQQPLAFFHDNSTGTLISRVLNDIALMQRAVSSVVVQLFRNTFQIIFLLGVVFYMNWKLALITLVVIPLSLLPIIKFGRKFRKNSKKGQEETAEITNTLHETIGGNRIVKAFCREKYEERRFQQQVQNLFRVTIKRAQYKATQNPMMELIGGFAIAAIIFMGGHEVINGNMTPGTFFAFITALAASYEPIKKLSGVNSQIQDGLASAERVYHILDITPAIRNKETAVPLPPFTKAISFNKVSFSYGEETILNNINLEVPVGQALAIVGPSGGGKTTLTNLIPRFLDLEEGSITIDGHDIRDITLHSLREQIAMVTQQTILFNDTVYNNIAYGKKDCSEEEIREAAKAAHCLNFIEELPAGFDTIIGEGGTKLSGGQQQRISIARALLADAPILVLDEATSALDTESERMVQKALENLMKNRTTFVIAHRLSTIKNADRIIVIKNGEIVEEGDHEQLLEKAGEYETLYNMQ